MKLLVYSDLHTDIDGYQPKKIWIEQADLVIQCGDLSTGTKGVSWLLGLGHKALFVPGNHEYWNPVLTHGFWDRNNEPCMLPKYTVTQLNSDFRDRLLGSMVTMLQCNVVIIDKVRFLGCTLWSDLSSTSARNPVFKNRNFDYILTDDFRLFSPDDHHALHLQHKAWLTEQLDIPFSGKTVVVTHFSPTHQSFTRSGESSIYKYHYSSDLDHLVEQADIWIHGHIHAQLDYQLGRCRVICNPRGTPFDKGRQKFKNLQLIEV